jgi:hypothetical protein
MLRPRDESRSSSCVFKGEQFVCAYHGPGATVCVWLILTVYVHVRSLPHARLCVSVYEFIYQKLANTRNYLSLCVYMYMYVCVFTYVLKTKND